MKQYRIGPYVVLEKIGEGAMGEVFKARDTLLNRFVAIKMMAHAIGSNPDLKRRFMREAQSAALLNHPNVITIYQLGEDAGRVYIAMELLDGPNLRSVIDRGALPTLADKLRAMDQILDGVAYAHTMNVTHRDLKPANIHLQRNGQAKIVDFGLARVGASDITADGAILGTPNYMSPEQVRGDAVGPYSDVFSLGVVFYEILCGRRAFDGDSVHTVLYRVAHVEPRPLAELCPDAPRRVIDVVSRSMMKEASRRFPHAGAMRAALGPPPEPADRVPTLITRSDSRGADEPPPPPETLVPPARPSDPPTVRDAAKADPPTIRTPVREDPPTVPSTGPPSVAAVPTPPAVPHRAFSRVVWAGLASALVFGGTLWWQRSATPEGPTEPKARIASPPPPPSSQPNAAPTAVPSPDPTPPTPTPPPPPTPTPTARSSPSPTPTRRPTPAPEAAFRPQEVATPIPIATPRPTPVATPPHVKPSAVEVAPPLAPVVASTPAPMPSPTITPTPAPTPTPTPTPTPSAAVSPQGAPAGEIDYRGLLSARSQAIGRREALPGQPGMELVDALKGERWVWFRFVMSGGRERRINHVQWENGEVSAYAQEVSGKDLHLIVQLPRDKVGKRSHVKIRVAGAGEYVFKLNAPWFHTWVKELVF